MGTEAHVYALAVSASVLLAFYPFLIVMLSREYGMFHNSVTILLWSFVAAMVILAGAEWADRRGEVARPADRIS